MNNTLYYYRFGLSITLLCLGYSTMFSQARLVLNNGGVVRISNGAYLVIDNPATNAITRNTSGHIISEGITNRLKWNIGTATGTYTVPLFSSSYIPIAFTIATAGVGAGNFQVSTYGTTAANTPYPTGVTNVDLTPGVDNSAYVADRFWQIDAQAYTTKPALTNLMLTYLASEIAAPNTITENNLQAQRFNTTTGNWDGTNYPPAGTVNTTNKTVTISSLSAANFFSSWAIVDNTRPLPIELLSFTATPEEGQNVRLNWSTATERDNDFFTVQRSRNGKEFSDLIDMEGAGTTTTKKDYTYLDINPLTGRSYYRLKQTDFNGDYSFSNIRSVEMEDKFPLTIIIYPNPVADKLTIIASGNHTIESVNIVNYLGLSEGSVDLKRTDSSSLDGTLAGEFDMSQSTSGFYMIVIVHDQGTKYVKLIKK